MPEKSQETSARTGEIPRLERLEVEPEPDTKPPESVPEVKNDTGPTTGLIRVIPETSDKTATREAADKPAGE